MLYSCTHVAPQGVKGLIVVGLLLVETDGNSHTAESVVFSDV